MGRKRPEPKPLEPIAKSLGLKERRYYVAEVSWRETNPPHRVILYTGFSPDIEVELYSGSYENVEKVALQRLHSVKIISLIKEI